MSTTRRSCIVTRPRTPTPRRASSSSWSRATPNGKLSKHIVNLNVGDELAMKGPFVKFEYKPNQYKSIGFGSGIAPALQVIMEVCYNPNDSTQVSLIFCNQAEKDIILRDELDALQYMYPQFQVHYVLDKAEENWEGYTGYVTKALIEKLLPGPSDESLIGVCGLPPMMNAISGKLLGKANLEACSRRSATPASKCSSFKILFNIVIAS
ncbi:unnamed protein product [Phytophthora lilii]|uniref:Unnamed protein product n=1 Tax=Phytophthora lilii TaxID=2077276 RepID=A0A9W6U7T4_9STRA|nr:unnamed protein product [Phytophthora lilii]